MPTDKFVERLEEIRFRHKDGRRILAMSKMSTEAGLSINAVQQIVSGKVKKPDPDTIKALTDRWGTPEDYRELMRLAGHPLPGPAIDEEKLFQALAPVFDAAGITLDQIEAARQDEQSLLESLIEVAGLVTQREEKSFPRSTMTNTVPAMATGQKKPSDNGTGRQGRTHHS